MAAKVLLVEDDNNLREIYEARLQAEGYAIVSAKDGEEALVVAKAEKPDLIVSDVMMPKISGFEMLDILRNTDGLKDTKVIMLTALGQTDDKTRADSLGADRYLVKSQVTLEDIVKAAHELLGDSTPEAVSPVEETTAATPEVPSAPAPDPAITAASGVTAEPVAAPVNPVETTEVPTTPEPVVEPTVTPVGAPDEPAAAVAVASEPVTPVEPTAPVATPESAPAAEPVTPTPAPAVPVSPIAEPTVAPEPVVAAEPTVTPTTSDASTAPLDASSTTAEEQATMESQIESFVNQTDATTPPPAATPAPTAPDLTADDTTSAHDNVMADAIDDLAESTAVPQLSSEVTAVEVPPAAGATPTSPVIEPTVTPTPPAAPTDDDSNDSVTVAHKKIIRPLDAADTKPDLNALLAAEEAKNIITNQAPVQPTTTPDTAVTPGTTTQPGGTVSPSSNDTPPSAPKNPNGFDPNSIAL